MYFFSFFTKADQHNVLVTHYGIRRLQSNTLRVGFPSRDILLGESPAWQSRQSEPSGRRGDETKRCEKKTLGCDPHTQSLTFIINYGCFCFILPQPLTTELLAVGDGENGEQRGGKAIFIKKNYLSKQVRWMRRRAESQQGLLRAMWTDEDLFGFNRKRVSSER